jgi:hypothetical protein
MSQPAIIRGGCHCRALRFELSWPTVEPSGGRARLPARRCDCSFCTRIDGVWTSHPGASLTVHEVANTATRYRFGTQTADFHICSRCGITPLVTCELEGRRYAVVNVNTFDDEVHEHFEIGTDEVSFEGESVDDRLSRRKARWVGQVEWVTSQAPNQAPPNQP